MCIRDSSLAERLLEKETVLGKELDELISSMKPGFEFPSKTSEVEENGEAAKAETKVETDAEATAEAQTKAGNEAEAEAENIAESENENPSS